MMDLIHSGEVCLILNTPTKGRHSERDGFRLRRAATEYKITCLTSLDTAAALVAGLKLGLTEKDVTPVGLQNYREETNETAYGQGGQPRADRPWHL